MGKHIAMDREDFFNKLKPYLNKGLVRFVYIAENFCVLNFGEILYLLSTYDVMGDIPLGVFIPSNKLIDYVKDETLPLYYMKYCYEKIKEHSEMFYELDPKKIDFWKNWVESTKTKFNDTNYDIEKEISKIITP